MKAYFVIFALILVVISVSSFSDVNNDVEIGDDEDSCDGMRVRTARMRRSRETRMRRSRETRMREARMREARVRDTRMRDSRMRMKRMRVRRAADLPNKMELGASLRNLVQPVVSSANCLV